jgi:hypothetical protein
VSAGGWGGEQVAAFAESGVFENLGDGMFIDSGEVEYEKQRRQEVNDGVAAENEGDVGNGGFRFIPSGFVVARSDAPPAFGIDITKARDYVAQMTCSIFGLPYSLVFDHPTYRSGVSDNATESMRANCKSWKRSISSAFTVLFQIASSDSKSFDSSVSSQGIVVDEHCDDSASTTRVIIPTDPHISLDDLVRLHDNDFLEKDMIVDLVSSRFNLTNRAQNRSEKPPAKRKRIAPSVSGGSRVRPKVASDM